MPTKTFYKLDPLKREKIIACAVDLFAHNGYSHTSMEAVAEASGIAKGALYRYFEGKKDLFLMVVDSLVMDLENYAADFLERRKDSDVFETIRDHMATVYEFQKLFPVHQQILCNVLYQEDLEFKGEVLAKFGMLSTQYTRLLFQHGIARGEVREEIDLDAAAFIIECVIKSFHHGVMRPFLDHGFGLYQAPQEVVNRKADLVVECFRRALGKSVPPETQTGEKSNTKRKS